MTLLSLKAFAASHGVSKQAATGWKAKGALIFTGNRVEVEASNDRMRAAGLGRFRDAAGTTAPARGVGSRAPTPASHTIAPDVAAVVAEAVTDFEAAVADGEIDEEIAGGFIEQLLAGQFRSKVEAAAIKENALALKHLLAGQKEAGRLVELETAESVLCDSRRAARDAWMAWPGRFAPLLAADLDIDGAKLAEALKPYIHQQMDELGEPDLDWSKTDDD